MYSDTQIREALDIYNAEQQAIVEKAKEEVMPQLFSFIKQNKDKLVGVQFSTGNLDDMYEVKRVEADDVLVLFQTWNSSENEGEFEDIQIIELDFEQMKEIFVALENK